MSTSQNKPAGPGSSSGATKNGTGKKPNGQKPISKRARAAAAVEAPGGPLQRAGQWMFVRRGWLPWLMVPYLMFGPRFGIDLGLQGIAAALALLVIGHGFRFWAVGYAGTRTRTRTKTGQLKDLVTAGPYSHVRNPIYVGNWFMAMGMILLFGHWALAIPFGLLVFFSYQPVVRWEERLLVTVFGEDYERFLKYVPRWLPSLKRYQYASSHPFLPGTALFSERGTFGSTACVLLLYGIREWVLANGWIPRL
jgi:protein-S-isoprenylcysteine O-methyltransferase Ste14